MRALKRAWRVAASVTTLVVGDAARNWLRNLRTVTPAAGSMSVLLLLVGLAALSGLAVSDALRTTASDASVVHAYLRSQASTEDVNALVERLLSDPRVASVHYVSSAAALAAARRRPGLSDLIDEAGTNPFPASLDVHVVSLADVGAVASGLTGQPALDPSYPTSYDAGAYEALQRLLRVAGAITAAVLAVLAVVAAAVTANAIRAAILARSDDLEIMRLFGASGWMVRGPFVFEGALTGEVAGLFSAAALLALFATAQHESARTFTALLPGVGWGAVDVCAGGLVLAGAGLGAVAAAFGTRGLRS